MRLPARSLALAVVAVGLSVAFADDAPRVVRMAPENGAVDVEPGLDEIAVTFSEPMLDRSWSVTGGGENFPKITSIRYRDNGTVLVMKVSLEAGRTYRFGLNSPAHRNFRSRKGVPLEPVLVTFRTKGRPGGQKNDQPRELPSLGRIDFELQDVGGLTVRSQDYAGIPLFIAFGAAW